MGFFDGRYYSLLKFNMSVLGAWPYQPSWVRGVVPLTQFAMTMSMFGFTIVTMVKNVGDLDGFITPLPYLCVVLLCYTEFFNTILKSNQLKSLLEKVVSHWEELEGTPAAIVLHKFAERARFVNLAYTVYIYSSMSLYLVAPFLPFLLDKLDPLNETRPKDFLYETDYGFDRDPYYVPVLAHAYLGTILTIAILVGIEPLYVLLVEHACALFEIIGFNLNMETADYMAGRKNTKNCHDDHDYQKICDCIVLHSDAIRFADSIESVYAGAFIVLFATSMITISISGIQALIKYDHPEILMRLASFTIAQIFHLWFISLPGQRLMDHSVRVHENVFGWKWTHISVSAQKLLIPIMARSVSPCILTAGKVYVISIENYSQLMQSAASYFMMFSSLR